MYENAEGVGGEVMMMIPDMENCDDSNYN